MRLLQCTKPGFSGAAVPEFGATLIKPIEYRDNTPAPGGVAAL